ncbi:MAG: polyprenol monophosphomannose synthase [Candidatus Bathyarchaeia archaeon]
MNTQASHQYSIIIEKQFGSLGSEENINYFIEGNLERKSEIGLILPTYCEAANIEKVIREVENLNLDISILVIDDSSPDKTAEIVRKLQKRYNNIMLFVRPRKLGLGTAIIDGFKIFLSSKKPPKYIVTMDADYSHNPKDLPRLIAVAKRGNELIIGSRYSKGGSVSDWSTIRLAISKVANRIASIVIGAPIHDYTSGMRCYSAKIVKTILEDLHSQTYEIQIETIRQSHLRGFKIKEVPIKFANRKKGKSKLTPSEIIAFLSHILKSLMFYGRTT